MNISPQNKCSTEGVSDLQIYISSYPKLSGCLRSLYGLVIALLLLPITASLNVVWAQASRGAESTLRVVVLDPAGAAAAGATIQLDGADRAATADARGEARIGGIFKSKVRVVVKAPGFRAHTT